MNRAIAAVKALFSGFEANRPLTVAESIRAIRKVAKLPADAPTFAEQKQARLAPLTECSIDIVICIHNALAEVKACLDSVLPTLDTNHRLILVDDASNEETAAYLRTIAERDSRIQLIHNESAVRYTKAANQGLKASTAELVILQNSDTVVSPQWSLKLAEVAFSSPNTGIVGPLSNAASHQSIPDTKGSRNQTAINELPTHLTIAMINELLEQVTPVNSYPTVPLVHGFCLAIRRELLEKIGYLDEEHFPLGYGEENDYCLRAAQAGFKLKIATHTYIFHAKSKSYQEAERIPLMQASFQTLLKQHTPVLVHRSIKATEQNPVLKIYRRLALGWQKP